MWHLLTWNLTHIITQQLEVFIVRTAIITHTYNKSLFQILIQNGIRLATASSLDMSTGISVFLRLKTTQT